MEIIRVTGPSFETPAFDNHPLNSPRIAANDGLRAGSASKAETNNRWCTLRTGNFTFGSP